MIIIFLLAVSGLGLILFGYWLIGAGCLVGSYLALMCYNRICGDGEPTFTYDEYKKKYGE
jgi:hypothetical protein